MYTLNDTTLVLISRDHSSFIKQCLDSINKEFLGDIKIISVDVSSKDHTKKIIEEYANEIGLRLDSLIVPYDTPTLLVLKKLSAVIHSRFIVLLSGDDTLGFGYRKSLESALKSMNTPCVVNFRLSITDSKLKQINTREPKWSDNLRANIFKLSIGNPGTAPGSLIPWEVLKSTSGWDVPPPLLIEDYWIWWMLVEKVKFINNIEGSVNYRQHEASTSKSSASARYAFSLGYVSALPTIFSKPLIGKIIGLSLIFRWIRHLNLVVWKHYFSGYLSALQQSKHKPT